MKLYEAIDELQGLHQLPRPEPVLQLQGGAVGHAQVEGSQRKESVKERLLDTNLATAFGSV